MKRVLYLSYDGMTDPLGQSQVLPYLIGLTKKGYQFTLISFEKAERLNKGKAIIEKICHENHIDWHPLPYTKTPPILSTLKDFNSLKKKIRDLHKADPFLLVHCRSYITALAGLWMKKKWGVKMIFDMRGFWADERVDGGLWNLKNPLFRTVYWYFKRKEKKFFEQADYTISLTHNAEKVIHSWQKITGQPIPIQVIPCCVDLTLFDPAAIQLSAIAEKKKELNIPEGVSVLSYIGSIGTWYMLPEMLAFFKRWLQNEPGAIFLFVTNENKEYILAQAATAGIDGHNIRIGSAARTEVPLFISLCDYSLFFIKPVFSKKASSPTKQGEIMAMGIPLICNSNVGDTDHIVKEYHSGILIEGFNDSSYDKVIEETIKQTVFNGETIRAGAKQFFSLEEGVRRYEQVYENVLVK
jgi:glycosyltransferase involved in cell wall biosynthesis